MIAQTILQVDIIALCRRDLKALCGAASDYWVENGGQKVDKRWGDIKLAEYLEMFKQWVINSITRVEAEEVPVESVESVEEIQKIENRGGDMVQFFGVDDWNRLSLKEWSAWLDGLTLGDRICIQSYEPKRKVFKYILAQYLGDDNLIEVQTQEVYELIHGVVICGTTHETLFTSKIVPVPHGMIFDYSGVAYTEQPVCEYRYQYLAISLCSELDDRWQDIDKQFMGMGLVRAYRKHVDEGVVFEVYGARENVLNAIYSMRNLGLRFVYGEAL